MRILNVSYTMDVITGGGVAERSFQLSHFLVQAGADCRLLTLDFGDMTERKRILGDRLVALPVLLQRFYVPRVSMKEIEALVRNADLIHLMGHWSILNALVYKAARKLNKPYAVCPAGSLPIYGRSKIFKKLYNFLIGREIIRNSDLCIAITPDEVAHFAEYDVQSKIEIIPNGIAESDFTSDEVDPFRRKHALQRPFILFLGRVNPIKGPDLLVKAFLNLKDIFRHYDLAIVGPDGGLQTELKHLVEQHQAQSRVHFLGYLGGKEKSDAYHAAHVLAIPSRHEAMSIVALEAGICGTPVLLTDQCGFDALGSIGAGWVVPATIEGIEAGLRQIFENPTGRDQASAKIKDYVTQNFSWSFIVQRYFPLFRAVLGSK